MKININKIKSNYNLEISQAKANNFEAVMVPLNFEEDIYCLNNIEDEEYVYDIANDYGWDKFILIDFINSKERLINLSELEAA